MDSSLVSIIAPCYNGERYVGRFLDSIIAQTYKKIELILINDGSSDDTEKVIFSYKDQLDKAGITLYYVNQNNQGIGSAINNGLKLINGDYFSWLGTDDYCSPYFVETLVSFLDKNREYAVVRNDGYIVDSCNTNMILGKMADSNHDKHNPYLFENALLEKNFNFGYCMVRVSSFLEVNPRREIYPSREGQNWQILLPLFYKFKSGFIEEPLYYVVRDLNSVSRCAYKKGFDAVIKQKNEYQHILNNVIDEIDFDDSFLRDKYQSLIKEKYARMRMQVAYNYKKSDVVENEYKYLKSINAITIKDFILYKASKNALLSKVRDWIFNFIKR